VTEHLPYELLAEYRRFEVRRYPAHVVAEITVEGSFGHAGNRAFGPLAGYIGGRNQPREKVAMTAPVLQEPSRGPALEITAPATGEVSGDQHTVAFVMPAEHSLDSLPEPTDQRIRLREVPEQVVAAVRYSGRWTTGGFARRAATLREALQAEEIPVIGALRWARYDPPWTPWFLRRNEVLAPVDWHPPPQD
jgi:hypothetical protein